MKLGTSIRGAQDSRFPGKYHSDCSAEAQEKYRHSDSKQAPSFRSCTGLFIAMVAMDRHYVES